MLRAQQQDGLIQGRVTDTRGHPLRLLVHLLASGDIPAGDAYTDSNGQFTFFGLPNGDYWVVVEAEDFRPARQYVMLDLRVHPKAQSNVVLEPLEERRANQGQIIAGSAKSYELDAKKQGRPFDAKAIREFEKGNRGQQKENYSSAISHYQKALRIEPDFYPALNNLGAIFLRQKDHAHAEAVFLQSVRINPQDGEAYINLGHVLYEEGKYSQAVSRLDEGLKRSPGSPEGHFFLGSAFMKLGDLAKAEPNLKAATALDPAGMASAHLQLANLYLKRRDMSAAGVELQNYLQANPSDPQAPAIKKVLADIGVDRTN